MNSNMKYSFWGKSLEIKAIGFQHIVLKGTGDHYTIERPISTVQNIIFGEMYVEHCGICRVRNLTTNEVCEVEFKKRGWSGKDAFKIEGHAIDANN